MGISFKALTYVAIFITAGVCLSFNSEDEQAVEEPKCRDLRFKTLCIENLKGYTFAKSRVISIENRKDAKASTYGYTMLKGVTYLITTCTNGAEKNELKVTVKNPAKQLVMTNYLAATGKMFDKIVYTSKSTGKHLLEFEYVNDEGRGCGVCAIGFKPKE